MKKITLLTFLFMTAVLASNAQNIPNPSFEDWQNYSLGETPVGWNTSDSVIFANLGSHSAVKEGTDHCHLNFALKLISCGAFPIAGPGVATNGIISGSLTAYTISGGSPDTARSKFFNGCVEYNPTAGTDRGVISAWLLRWNNTSGHRDTIAYTVDTISTTPSLTSFSYPFVYRDMVNQPDTILILLQSSKAVFNASIGSTMIVDNLSLSGWVGINEANSPVKSVQLFPTPATNEVTINVELVSAVSMHYEIMDTNGKLIATDKMKSDTQKIDVSKLATGNYFITLRDDAGKKLCSDKFTIVR